MNTIFISFFIKFNTMTCHLYFIFALCLKDLLKYFEIVLYINTVGSESWLEVLTDLLNLIVFLVLNSKFNSPFGIYNCLEFISVCQKCQSEAVWVHWAF